MKRGEVDLSRSLLWNVVHYQWTDEMRVWSSAENELHNRVMFWHKAVMLGTVFLVICLLEALVGGRH